MSQSKKLLDQRYFMSTPATNADLYSAFWIRYKPDRLQLKDRKPWMRTLILVLLVPTIGLWTFVALTAGLNSVMMGYFSLITVVALGLALLTTLNPVALLAPTHIELNETGMRFHWLRLFFRGCTPLVQWDRISHVTTKNKTVGDEEQVTLEFNAITRGTSFGTRLSYALLAPMLTWGWLTSDRAQIHFQVDAIASSDDRKRLQTSLKKFLPSYRIEPKVADDLAMYIKFDSYTDLWLDKLGESSGRERDAFLPPGTTLASGGYEIIGQIGSGGQALVYIAKMLKAVPDAAGLDARRQETLVDFSDLPILMENDADGAPPVVVLKEFVLPVQAGTQVRKRVLENIQKEAKLWRKLRHPNIARLIDFFVEDQRAYLALEHVEGTSLKEVITTGGIMSELQVVELSIQMCDILGYLHRRQPPVIHRDFTPDNLILDKNGTVKLIDFNVAQQLEAQTTKTVVGKHSYIPPEQFRGKAVPQSDLYAFGATLFYLLTGKDPEPITQAHPRVDHGALSQEIDDIVAKATSLGLSTRYQECQEIKTDLLTLMETRYRKEA